MLKLLICFSIVINIFIQSTYAKLHASEEFLNKLKLQVAQEVVENPTCVKVSDCPSGFFCKNYDCIAKKQEQRFCLSGSNDECNCGKCQTDPLTWTKVCFQDDDEKCENNGESTHNSCKTDSDCPENFFCDKRNENLCTSKLTPGRLCHADQQCICDKCVEKHYYSRTHHKPLSYGVCDVC